MVAAVFWLYLAVFLLYHADERRTAFPAIRSWQYGPAAFRLAGWVLAVVVLFWVSAVWGWERGIPIWFGLFTLAGFLCVLMASLASTFHRLTGAGVLGLGVLAIVLGMGRVP